MVLPFQVTGAVLKIVLKLQLEFLLIVSIAYCLDMMLVENIFTFGFGQESPHVSWFLVHND